MYILFFYLFLNEYYNIECINKSILPIYSYIYIIVHRSYVLVLCLYRVHVSRILIYPNNILLIK